MKKETRISAAGGPVLEELPGSLGPGTLKGSLPRDWLQAGDRSTGSGL